MISTAWRSMKARNKNIIFNLFQWERVTLTRLRKEWKELLPISISRNLQATTAATYLGLPRWKCQSSTTALMVHNPPLRPKPRPIQAGFLTLFLTARTFHVCIESIGHYRILLKNRVYDIPQRSWTFFKPSARTASAVKSPLYGKRLGLVHGNNVGSRHSWIWTHFSINHVAGLVGVNRGSAMCLVLYFELVFFKFTCMAWHER